MPTYPLRCPACCRQVEVVCHSLARDAPHRCVCGEYMVRRWNYRFGRSFFPEAYNPGVGAHVSSHRQLYDEMKRKEEDAYLNSGVDTTYTLQDDPQFFGIDKDRLEWRRAEDARNRRAKVKAARAQADGLAIGDEGWQ